MRESINSGPGNYAALRLRFRAIRIDATICLGLFLVGGILAGIVLENSPGSRIAAFAGILTAILGYEPFMVARYGGTIGHRKSNIRIVRADSEENLPFWRAAIRSLVKQSVGIVSLVFMFVTSRPQGLHDLASGARVLIRDPLLAVEDDIFAPALSSSSGAPASWLRRIVVTLAYNAVLFAVLVVVVASSLSVECQVTGICTQAEDLVAMVAGTGWLILAGISMVLGWTGRLPGCHE